MNLYITYKQKFQIEDPLSTNNNLWRTFLNHHPNGLSKHKSKVPHSSLS